MESNTSRIKTGTIGILGGMGPEATIALYQRIVSSTPAQQDQDHIKTLIYSNPQIPDRTESILSQELTEVASELAHSAKVLENAGASFIVMPCNTAHFWINDVRGSVQIPVVDMIEETMRHIALGIKLKKVGLLATLGTVKAGLFQKRAREFGVEIVILDEGQCDSLMKIIIEIKKGHKSEDLIEQISQMRSSFHDENISTLILGCTELPLLYEKAEDWFVDPLDVLAKVAIRLAQGGHEGLYFSGSGR